MEADIQPHLPRTTSPSVNSALTTTTAMEALGAAASVAGLVSLAIEIPKLIDTAVSIRSAPDEAKQLSQTAGALVATLQRLEAFLKTDEARDLDMAADSALTVSISTCQSRVLALSKKLRSHSPQATGGGGSSGLPSIKAAATRFRWPFDKTECQRLISEIHAMQSTFEFCLIMKNCQQMAKSHREVIAYFKAQSDTLAQMEASFPDQAAHVSTMLDKIKVVESYVSDASRTLSHIQVGVEELQMMKRDLAEHHADKLHGQALEWLSRIDPSEKHEEVRAARLAGTCEQILRHADFRRWVNTPRSEDYAGVTCWVGDPGQGKTFTMSRIIDHLHELHLFDNSIHVAYLYCDYQRTKGYSETSLTGAIVRQLLAQLDQLPKEVSELIRHAHLKLRRPSARMNEIIKILAHLKPIVKRLFVCVDALDECKDADMLVAACAKFPLPTSFIFLGRRSIIQTVKQSFPNTIERLMELQHNDVDAIVTERVKAEKHRQLELMPDWLMEDIRVEVSRLANGMLLLASLHTALVLSHDTIHHRQEALKNLSSTLESAFSQSIARIQESRHSSRAFRVLGWIHLVRPLSLNELGHALAVECQHDRFYADNLPSSDAILDCCLGLVTLDDPKGSRRNFDLSARVTLVHSTLSVYLDSHPEILREVAPTLAEICLTYLSFDPSERFMILESLMSDSWLQLLHKSQPLAPELVATVRVYCEAVNTHVNRAQSYVSLATASVTLPRHARAVTSHLVKVGAIWKSPTGLLQSMINTVCMLGLDAFDPILLWSAVPGIQVNINSVLSYDIFGMTPLGWALLPRSQFGNCPGARSFTCSLDSFEDGLQRAERLIEVFRVLDPFKPMWNTDTLAAIRATYSRNGHRIRYFFSTPFLFLLENCLSAPGATQRCISKIENYTNITFWSSFRRSPQTCSQHTWSLLMLRMEPEIEREVFREPKKCIASEFAAKAPWAAEDDNDGERRRSAQKVVRWMTAFFEPASSVPLLFVPDGLQDRCHRYCQGRDDVMQEATEQLPENLCRVYMLRREALLHVGAASDSVGIVNYALFKCKVDANRRDNKDQTALHIALNLGSNSAADILIRLDGIDMSVGHSKDATLLHVCVRREQPGFASIILDKHPELINAGDQLGKTALHYAVSRPSPRMVKLLLANGADINIDDATGNTPLHEAILKQDAHICNILMESQSGDEFSAINLQRAWNLAFEAGASFIMTLLRALKSNSSKLLTAGDDQTSSALTYSKRTLALLLANENTPDFTEADLAFMLELSRDPQVSGSASLSMISVNSAITILTAMIKGAGNVAAFLLRRFPIDLHHLGQDGESVLHLAVTYDARPVVKLLLDNDGTDFALLDPQGHTALTLALMYKRLQVLQMLLDCPRVQFSQITSNGVTPLHLAIVHRFFDAIPLLLANPQVPTNQLDGSGRTPLHRAVMQQDSAVVRLLIECPRVVLETPSGDGRTALAYAAQYADEEMVSLLLDTGKFDVMQKDSYGKTALEWARLNTSSRVWSAIKKWSDDAPA